LWARARIAELLDQRRRGADEEQTRQAVVATALAHHLVSKFTSLVAVDQTPERPLNRPLSQKPVGNLAPQGQAITGFPATATNAAQLRFAGLACVLLASLLLLGPALSRRLRNGPLA
jgi:Ca-activated chloride channel family protein